MLCSVMYPRHKKVRGMQPGRYGNQSQAPDSGSRSDYLPARIRTYLRTFLGRYLPKYLG